MGDFDNLSVLKPFRNGPYLIVPIHYSHDPDKDSEWRESEQQKYIKRDPNRWEELWNREQEMDFSSVGGALAYSTFTAANLLAHMPLRGLQRRADGVGSGADSTEPTGLFY
jgi:hypothetical protein